METVLVKISRQHTLLKAQLMGMALFAFIACGAGENYLETPLPTRELSPTLVPTRVPPPTAVPPTRTPVVEPDPTPYVPDHGPLSNCGPGYLSNDPIPHAQFVEWTPDGIQVIFNYKTSIMAVGTDGTGLRTLVDANTLDGANFQLGFLADISPDGQHIVYTSCQFPTGPASEIDSFNYELATINLDGTGLRRLTENDVADHYPAWSPDGKQILFLSGSSPPSWPSLIAYDSTDPDVGWDTYEMRRVGHFLVSYPPQWSPDGGRVAVLTGERRPEQSIFDYHVYVVGEDGSDPVKLSGTVGAFSWSPDGTELAVARVRGDGTALYAVKADGTGGRLVGEISANRPDDGRYVFFAPQYIYSGSKPWIAPVSWSPGGSHILYLCEVWICVRDLDGNLVGQSPTTLTGLVEGGE